VEVGCCGLREGEEGDIDRFGGRREERSVDGRYGGEEETEGSGIACTKKKEQGERERGPVSSVCSSHLELSSFDLASTQADLPEACAQLKLKTVLPSPSSSSSVLILKRGSSLFTGALTLGMKGPRSFRTTFRFTGREEEEGIRRCSTGIGKSVSAI